MGRASPRLVADTPGTTPSAAAQTSGGDYSGRRFRASVLRYLGGRGVNAVLAFTVLVLLARTLPADQYAAYVSAFALLEITMLMSSLGMEWVTGIYIPQIRLKGAGTAMTRFVGSVVAIQAVAAALLGVALWFFAAPIAGWMGMAQAAPVYQLYGVVVFLEAVSRVMRDQILSCLLLQGASQLAQTARNVVLLACIVWLLPAADVTALHVAQFEIFASASSLVVGAAFVGWFLWRQRHQQGADPDWRPPALADMFSMGRAAWVANLASLAWGSQVIVLLTTKILGAEAGAMTGFVRNLAEQVRRYLPAELLFGILRPVLVARYADEQDLSRLASRCSFLFKLNTVSIALIVVACLVCGDHLFTLLTAGRYPGAADLAVVWFAVFVFAGQRRYTDLLLHTAQRSRVIQRTSLLLVPAPLLIFVVLTLFRDPVFALFAVAAIELAYTLGGLHAARLGRAVASVDWWGGVRILLAAGLVGLGGHWLADRLASQWAVYGTALVAAGLFMASLWLISPLSASEASLVPERFARLRGALAR